MKKQYWVILLILISLIPLFDFLHAGFPVTHDGQDHIARIANFYQSLSEGILVPRWAANLNWGYGHPILMFLYPLPSYMASFFHALRFSFVDSTKLVFIVSFILSGLTMYVWFNEMFGTYPAVIAALLYLFAPYRFVDIYVRGAIGEHVAFVFPPLILYFLLKLSKKNFVWDFIGATLSVAGLILSHNAISLMFMPIILLYVLYLIWQSKQKKLLICNYFMVLFLGFGLSAFFWIPAFFEGKYTLRDIVTDKDYSSRFVQLKDFFSFAWSYGGTDLLSKSVGVIQWFFVIASFPILFQMGKKDNKTALLLTGGLIVFIESLFIMNSASKYIWETITLIQKFQFPWRFLSLTVFATAVIGGIVYTKIPKKYQLLSLIIISLLLLLANSGYWHANNYLTKPESFYTSIYNGTTDTGESSPIWSVRFMETRPNAFMEVIDGKATVVSGERKTTKHVYHVTADEKTRLRENTLYFPGWQVLVDGKSVPLQFQDPSSRGIMTFWVEKGTHTVSVLFTETRLRIFSDFFSVVCLFLMFIWGILVNKYIWQHSR